MTAKRADVGGIREWVDSIGLAGPVRGQIMMALEELEALRGAPDSALQIGVLKARVAELLEARPAKAEQMKACFADVYAQLAKKCVEVDAVRSLARELLGLGRRALKVDRGVAAVRLSMQLDEAEGKL